MRARRRGVTSSLEFGVTIGLMREDGLQSFGGSAAASDEGVKETRKGRIEGKKEEVNKI